MKRFLIGVAMLATLASSVWAQEEDACKPLPKFSMAATDGKTYSNVSLTNKASVVVFFYSTCPHVPKAVPDMNRLAKQFGTKATLIGVTELPMAEAKAWAKANKVAFPLISDPNGKLASGFGAKHSLDLALLCPHDKTIATIFEGYDQGILRMLFAAMPAHGGPKIQADLSAYPKTRKSGCAL